jgi:hypothetical protein
MRWPCAEWFHIPSEDEVSWLKDIMTWLSLTTWDDWRIKLHMPFTWQRSFSNAAVQNTVPLSWWAVWYRWKYRTSTPYQDSTLKFNYYFSIYSYISYVGISYDRHWMWASIRPFKDWFVTPDSSWTVITWTLGSAWIFWDITNWLISITWDGTTWYTIADKNLWATTVYSDWDTLSEANCGKFYQWWNNYWFAWTWSITTSSTQVNASTYWPWNYYSSSTFITGNDGVWDSSYNLNLRWWVTWIIFWWKYVWEEIINEVPTNWTVWQVLTKNNNGYEFKNSVLSWDSWTNYIVKVSTSAPSSATNNTITIVK